MKLNFLIILLLNMIISILISYYNTLLDDRDYLFKLELRIYFKKKNSVFIYVIDLLIIFV